MSNAYWRTPAAKLDPAYELQRSDEGYAGPSREFGLDPFSTRVGVHSHVVAKHYLREDRRKRMGGGAFATPWKPLAGNRLSFANPPYCRDKLGACMKLMQEQADTGVWLVNLVPASTDVGWFHDCWESAEQVCFWKGRIRFEDPRPRADRNSALFPNVSFHWPGDHNREARMESFHRIFSSHGIVVPCGSLAKMGSRVGAQSLRLVGGLAS